MKVSTALFFVVASLVLSACGSRYVLREVKNFDQVGWLYADSLQATLALQDTARIYDIQLLVHHSEAYPYQNLYVRIHTIFPNGKRLSQPLSLELADKSGRWFGKGRQNRKLVLPIQENAYFNEKGTYRFVIEQFMRVDLLVGVQAIGLQVVNKGAR